MFFIVVQFRLVFFFLNPQKAKVSQELNSAQSYTSNFISAIDLVILRLALVNRSIGFSLFCCQ